MARTRRFDSRKAAVGPRAIDARHLACPPHEVGAGDAAVDEAPLRRLAPREQPAGVDELERAVRARPAKRTPRARRCRGPRRCARTASRSGRRRPRRRCRTPGRGRARCRDRRRAPRRWSASRRPAMRVDQRVEDVAKDRLAILVQRIRVGEIAPAAERAPLAANQERPRTAGLRRRRGLGDVLHHREVHRVHLVRAVEHQLGDAAVDGQQDRSGPSDSGIRRALLGGEDLELARAHGDAVLVEDVPAIRHQPGLRRPCRTSRSPRCRDRWCR